MYTGHGIDLLSLAGHGALCLHPKLHVNARARRPMATRLCAQEVMCVNTITMFCQGEKIEANFLVHGVINFAPHTIKAIITHLAIHI